MRKFLLLVSLFVVCMGSSVFAQQVQHQISVQGGVGYFSPTGDLSGKNEDGSTWKDDFKGGVNFNIAGHYYFTQNIGIGVNVGMFDSKTDPKAGDKASDIQALLFGVSALYRYPLGNLEPYAGLGLSYAKNSIDGEDDYENKKTYSASGIAFTLELGAKYYVMDALYVGGSFSYLQNEQSDKLKSEDVSKTTFDYSGAGLNLLVGYSF